ncbi:MAG: hypothetical protein MPW15_24240 [Candidatus Manganitrophus sp.]|nr:hypothetical protein [Candidatus Manganitrophus sp.]
MAPRCRLGEDREDEIYLERHGPEPFQRPERRVFVYYDLLSADNIPLASNVANKTIEPLQTVEVVSDSYINSSFLPDVKSSRVTVKLRFPN